MYDPAKPARLRRRSSWVRPPASVRPSTISRKSSATRANARETSWY